MMMTMIVMMIMLIEDNHQNDNDEPLGERHRCWVIAVTKTMSLWNLRLRTGEGPGKY